MPIDPAAGKDHGSINPDLGLPTKALFEFMEGA